MKYFLLLASILCLLSACDNEKSHTQTLEAFYEEKGLTEIDKIVLQDGSNGETKTLQDAEQIEEFLSLIKDIEYTPSENQNGMVGWRYRIRLFDQLNEFDFTLSEIDGVYYNSEPDIYPIVGEYYQNIEVTP